MKIEITTTAKAIKIVNCILGRTIIALKENNAQEAFGLSEKDLKIAEELKKIIEKIFKHVNYGKSCRNGVDDGTGTCRV